MENNGVDILLERVRRRSAWSVERRKAARTNVGVSLRELGSALGVTHVAVSKWEDGTYNPQQWENEDAYFDALEKLEQIHGE